MLHAVLHPKAHKRDLRHQNNKSVIDLNVRAPADGQSVVNLNVEAGVDPKILDDLNVRARADQTFGLENSELLEPELYHHPTELKRGAKGKLSLPLAYEKCGVSHLVHLWAPQGHSVNDASIFKLFEIMRLIPFHLRAALCLLQIS